MSSDVYFVLIRDFQHKKQLREVTEWLEENVVLGHGEAEQMANNLPFDIPMGFPSKEEAKEFTTKLQMYGCILEFDSLSERNARAAEAAARKAAKELEAAEQPQPAAKKKQTVAEKGESGPTESAETSEDEGSQRPRWLIPAAAALGVVVVALGVWMGADKVDTKALSEWSDKVDMDIVSMLQADSKSGSPFSEVVGNMQRHIDKQNYSKEERVDHSNTYMGEVKGEQPVKNRETRQRNILMLQASIGFYRENKKAWRRLVDEYRLIGATLKVEELRKEMVEIFGEAETAEILEENE